MKLNEYYEYVWNQPLQQSYPCNSFHEIVEDGVKFLIQPEDTGIPTMKRLGIDLAELKGRV